MTYTLHFNSYEPAIRYHISQRLCANGWQTVSHPNLATLSDDNLSLNDDVSILLEYKHLLALLTQRFCPNVCPETFALNDINYRQVIENLWYHKQAKQPWILKPSLLNNGDYIFLFENMKAVVEHYVHAKRLPGDHVLQRYIQKPDLWEGRKYTFRIPAVLTSDRGVYLYQDGYLNISAVPYTHPLDVTDRRGHITNYILDGHLAGINQLSTKDFPNFDKLYPKFCKQVAKVVGAVTAVFPEYLSQKPKPTFEIFGFDFMLDSKLRPFLLEVNQGPDFPMIAEHPLNQSLWDPFWQSIIDEFILPIATKQFTSTSRFTQVLSYQQASSPGRWARKKGQKFFKIFEKFIVRQT